MMTRSVHVRWLICLLTMLLCLSLGTGLAEELDTSTDLSALHLLTKAEDFVDTFYLEGDYIFNGPIIHLDNYWALQDNVFHHDSNPEFALSFPNGGEEYFKLDNYSYYGIARVQSCPSEPMTVDAVMSCTWGDMYAEYPFQVHFVRHPNGPLQAISLPSVIQTAVGEKCTIAINGFTPQDWLLDGAICKTYIGQGNADPFEVLERNATSCVIEFTEPGAHEIIVNFECANFISSKRVTVNVADENGNLIVPVVPEFEFAEVEESNVLYKGVTSYQGMTEIQVVNAEAIYEYTGQDTINWTAEYVNNDTQVVLIPPDASGSTLWIKAWNPPYTTNTIHMNLTATCGDLSATYTKTFPIIDLGNSIPTSMALPASYDLTVGESFTVDATKLNSTTFTYDGPEGEIKLTQQNHFDAFSVEADGNDQYTVTANVPGVYLLEFRWKLCNLIVNGKTNVIVRNADGTIPSPEAQFTSTNSWERLFTGGNSATSVASVTLDNSEAFDYLYDLQNVEWSVGSITGSDFTVKLHTDVNRPYWCRLDLVNQPTIAGDAVVEVLCTLHFADSQDDFTATVEIPVSVVDPGIEVNTDPNCIGSYTVVVGESIYISSAAMFNDHLSNLYGGMGASIYYNQDAMRNMGVEFINDMPYEVYSTLQSGAYRICVDWEWSNYRGINYANVFITDSDGSVPTMPELDLVTEQQHSVVYANLSPNTLLGTFTVENAEALSNAYNRRVNWEVTVLEGDASLIEILNSGSYSSSKALYLKQAPTADGKLVVQATAKTMTDSVSKIMTFELSGSAEPMEAPVLTNAIHLDTYFINGGYNYINVMEVTLENYSDYSNRGIAPVWSCEITGDTSNALDTQDLGRRFWVCTDSIPSTESDITIKVTCTVGDQSASLTKQLAVRHLPSPCPYALNLPESVTVNAGQTFTIDAGDVLPTTFTTEMEAEDVWLTLLNETDNFECTSSGLLYTCKALQPGMYTLQFMWRWHTLTFRSQLPVIVRNADGTMPDCAPEYTISFESCDIFVGGNNLNYTMSQLSLSNLSTMDQLYDLQGIAWTVEDLDNSGLKLELEQYNPQYYNYNITLCSAPSKLGTYRFNLNCHLAFAADGRDQTLTIPFTAQVVSLPANAPTAPVDMGSEHVTVGEEFTFNRTQASYADLFDNFNCPGGNSMEFPASINRIHSDGSTETYAALEAGVYRVQCLWSYSNFQSASYKTIYVDTDGSDFEIPTFSVKETVHHDTVYITDGINLDLITYEYTNPNTIEAFDGSWWSRNISFSGDDEGIIDWSNTAADTWRTVIYLRHQPTKEADITVTTILSNGIDQKVFTNVIHVRKLDNAPTSAELPSYVIAKLGESVSLDASEMVNGWVPATGKANIEFVSTLFSEPTVSGNVYTWTATESGLTWGSIYWEYANIRFSRSCAFIVKDANGTLPDGLVDYGISTEPTTTHFIGGTRKGIADLTIHNLDFMAELTGVSKPEWSYEFTGSIVPSVSSSTSTAGDEYSLDLQESITEPCVLTFTVYAKWGDAYTLEVPHEITYVDLGDDTPTGINMPDVLDMNIGDSFRFMDDTVLPNGWDTDNGSPFRLISDESILHSCFEQTYLGGGNSYKAQTPGVYHFNFFWGCQNLAFNKDVTIRVFDENGQLPDPEVEYSTYQIGDGVLYANGTQRMLSALHILNYDALATLTGVAAPTWSISQTSGPAAQLYISPFAYDTSIGVDVNMGIDMPQACTISYVLTAEWGDQLKKEWEYTVEFIDLGADRPTAIDMPDSIILSPGESFTLSATAVRPTPWGETEPMPNVFLLDEPTVSKSFDVTFDMYDIVCTARVPGVYRIRTEWMHKNILLSHQFDVLVRDADGNLPLGILSKSTQTRFPIGTTWKDVGTAEIPQALYSSLHEATGTLPVWSGVIAETGKAVTITTSDDHRTASIALTDTPATAGSYTVDVTVRWNDMSDTVSLPIKVVSANEEIQFPHANYTVLTGMTLELKASGPIGSCPYKYWRSSNTAAVQDVSALVFEAKASGSAVMTLYLTYEDSTRMVRTVTLNVADSLKTLRLPALLTEIEAEAFYGTNAQYVVIPSGVTRIDSGAFANASRPLLISIPASVRYIAPDAFTGTSAVILCTDGSYAESYAEDLSLPCLLI